MPKAVSLLVAQETQAWVDALYENGAVSFDAGGRVTIDPTVRDLIAQMHDALAAGDAARKAELEKMFDDAVEATSDLGSNLGPGTLGV
jgi:hypothetical protein